jgi:hypothetical protein
MMINSGKSNESPNATNGEVAGDGEHRLAGDLVFQS